MRDLQNGQMTTPIAMVEIELVEPYALTAANDAFFNIVGQKRKIGDSVLAFVSETDRALLSKSIAHLREEDEIFSCMVCLHEMECLCVGLRAENAANKGILLLFKAGDPLAEKAELFALLSASMNEVIIEYDVESDTLIVAQAGENAAYAETRLAEYIKTLKNRTTISPHDVQLVKDSFSHAAKVPGQYTTDFRTSFFAGVMRWCRAKYICVTDRDGTVTRFVGRIQDFHEQKLQELDIQERSERDSLTRLYNRNTGSILIDSFLETEKANHSEDMHALLMIDLDDFKQINDQLSHSFGDAVLIETADQIMAEFRSEDIVVRYGGDEFVVLVRKVTSLDSLSSLASRLCASVRRQYQIAGSSIDLSVSIGMALYPRHGTAFETLLHAADIANYHAKAAGKNRYFLYAGDDSIEYQNQHVLDENTATQRQIAKTTHESMEKYLLYSLHDATDKKEAITAALRLLAEHYGLQRAYILRYGPDRLMHPTGYSWYADGYSFDYSVFEGIDENELQGFFAETGARGKQVYNNLSVITPSVRGALEKERITQCFHYKYSEGGRLLGLIGLDNCREDGYLLSQAQMDELIRLLRVLALFSFQQSLAEHDKAVLSLLDQLPTFAYIVNWDTHMLLYANEAMRNVRPGLLRDTPCYEALYGRSEACEGCPLSGLDPERCGLKKTAALYAPDSGQLMQVTASWMPALGISNACLLNAIDISEYGK